MSALPTLTAPITFSVEENKRREMYHKIENENCFMEILVKKGALLTLILETKVDDGKSANITQNAIVEEGATLSIKNVTSGTGRVNHKLNSKVEGANAKSEIIWIFHATKNAKFELDVQNIFNAPNGKGDVVMKGVAEDEASIKANGVIKIGRKGAKTETELTENILMLDSTAKVDAVPALEIKTNDVKASHSATVTKVNEEDLFYMASRGIPKEEAKSMYLEGFLDL